MTFCNSHITFSKIRKIDIFYFHGKSEPNGSVYIHGKGDGTGDSKHQFGFNSVCWGSGDNAKCGTGDGYGTDCMINFDEELRDVLYFELVGDF